MKKYKWNNFTIICDNDGCDFEQNIESGNERNAVDYWHNEICPHCGVIVISDKDYKLFLDMEEKLKEFDSLYEKMSEEEKDSIEIVNYTVQSDGDGSLTIL